MGGEAIMWVVFAISFVGCAVTMGSIFIKPSDFEFLRGTNEPQQPAAKPAKTKIPVQDEAEDAESEDEEEEEPGAEDTVFKESVVNMMTFLETSLASLATKEFKFDSINKFGCHLFLAGAAEGASRTAGLNHDQFVEMLGKAVEVLGSNPEVAKKFSEKYEEYLLEPKYAEMFRSGGDAIETFLKEAGEDVSGALAQALEVWNKPAAESVEKDKLVTVLFTDLVGSTKMTQELGDAGAQEILRKHNEIVRNGLAKYQGLEVKHTGDGIMARFSVTSNAVESAIWMQEAFATNNEATPDRAVSVRIGINTGEPIQEEGDIFGTTVQLAARICDKGKTGHVMTSNVVRELCAGRQIRFEDCGPFDLKGVEGQVNLYFAFPT